MPQKIEQHLYRIDETKTLPAGYMVVVHVRDQWGDRRKIKERFRAEKGSSEAMERALRRARERREEIVANRENIDWLRAEFPTPIEKKKFDDPDVFFAHYDKFSTDDRGTAKALENYVELGLRVDEEERFSVDPAMEKRGFLRRLLEDTSKSNFHQKRGVWVIVKRWGGIHQKRLTEIEGEDVDSFVRYLERQTDGDGGPRYARSSIRRYRLALRSMIKGFAVHHVEPNPLEVSPTKKKPARVKGKGRRRKVPTAAELKALEEGLSLRVAQAEEEGTVHHRHLPRRQWALHVHQVLRGTGMRPSEALYLKTKHVDFDGKRILVEGGAVDGEPGLTKTGKQKGDREAGTRLVPVGSTVLQAIKSWLELRESIGFPPVEQSSIIFCDESGAYANTDSLRTHYNAGCDAVDASRRITPYQIRHWRNDYLRRQGMPSEIRQELLGHIKEETNLNYTHVKAEEARKWVEGE